MRLYSNALKAGVLGLSMLAAAPAFLMMAEPAKAGEAQAAAAPGAKEAIEQTRAYSAAEAGNLSLNPVKRIVMHYDANMSEAYRHFVITQAKKLRENGYHAIAIPGGPANSVKLYISGKTSDKLVFSTEDIAHMKPTDIAASYYQKLIGQPEQKPVDAASISLDRS